MRSRRVLGFGFLIVVVLTVATGCGGSKKKTPTTVTSPVPNRGLEKASAARAMASVFSHPSTGNVPQTLLRRSPEWLKPRT
jgi:hypothetical protein